MIRVACARVDYRGGTVGEALSPLRHLCQACLYLLAASGGRLVQWGVPGYRRLCPVGVRSGPVWGVVPALLGWACLVPVVFSCLGPPGEVVRPLLARGRQQPGPPGDLGESLGVEACGCASAAGGVVRRRPMSCLGPPISVSLCGHEFPSRSPGGVASRWCPECGILRIGDPTWPSGRGAHWRPQLQNPLSQCPPHWLYRQAGCGFFPGPTWSWLEPPSILQRGWLVDLQGAGFGHCLGAGTWTGGPVGVWHGR